MENCALLDVVLPVEVSLKVEGGICEFLFCEFFFSFQIFKSDKSLLD